jgi:hypothetical protein
MKSNFIYTATIFAVVAIIFFACRHEILVDNTAGTGGTVPASSACSTDSVYFIKDILPILASNCTMGGCHDVASHKDGVILTSYSNIIRYVSPGNAAGSKLYKVIVRTDNDRMPPPPMNALPQTQKDKIARWINQGAKNNNCADNCDTAIFTYSLAVKPIIDFKCAGCHNPSSLGGGIDVSTYNGVKIIALNGKLYGSITQQSGFSPMPKNGVKLSDCEITQIRKWTNAGSLNN